MKNKICATLTKDHIYICNGGVIGRSGENECTQLEITLDECLCDKWIYIDFSKPDGTTYKTSKLDIVNNKVIYDIPNALLDQKGNLKVQVVLQDEKGEVWKSTIKSYGVNPSINATDDIPNQDDFITEAQKLLNEVEEGLTPTIGDNGNWFILDKDTGKPSRGIQGEKGEKGDAGSIKFIIANELPIENIDESAIYMKAVESEDTQNTYEEYIYVNGAWESIGTANVQVDLTDYVKNTDYAAELTAGVVKVNSVYGLRMSSDHTIRVYPATNTEIDAKTTTYKPIVPSNLNYAVKTGMTTNTLEWTDEEKASARTLINAVGDTDYPTSLKAGVVRSTSSFGTYINNGVISTVKATESDIDAKTDIYKPIVPSNLDYAVKSVVGGHVTLTQSEYDALETKDENTYYYIVEE